MFFVVVALFPSAKYQIVQSGLPPNACLFNLLLPLCVMLLWRLNFGNLMSVDDLYNDQMGFVLLSSKCSWLGSGLGKGLLFPLIA